MNARCPVTAFLLGLAIAVEAAAADGVRTTAVTPPADVTSAVSHRPLAPDVLARAVAAEVKRLEKPQVRARRSTTALRQPAAGEPGWIKRHSVLFGTLVGFGAGFLAGYLPGDDAVFDDFSAGFNGLVLGGAGAAGGALIGWAASR